MRSLLDAGHSLHAGAMDWFASHAQEGWASCPITQNGCIRILSHPAYPSGLPVPAIVEHLARATANPVHQFWPDDVSALDATTFDATRIHGPRQLTDLYLLALAVRHDGRLVTFDRSIVPGAVKGAGKQHLLML